MVFCKAHGPLEWSRRSGRWSPCGAGIARDNKDTLEFIQTVESRDLIGLRERRIVKHRVAEIFDGRAHGQYCLSNVHNLGGAVPDNMYAQQFQRVWIEENLPQPLLVAKHLALGPFRIAVHPAR